MASKCTGTRSSWKKCQRRQLPVFSTQAIRFSGIHSQQNARQHVTSCSLWLVALAIESVHHPASQLQPQSQSRRLRKRTHRAKKMAIRTRYGTSRTTRRPRATHTRIHHPTISQHEPQHFPRQYPRLIKHHHSRASQRPSSPR